MTVSGPVELVEDVAEVRRWATAIGARYMGAARADEFGARNGWPASCSCACAPSASSPRRAWPTTEPLDRRGARSTLGLEADHGHR